MVTYTKFNIPRYSVVGLSRLAMHVPNSPVVNGIRHKINTTQQLRLSLLKGHKKQICSLNGLFVRYVSRESCPAITFNVPKLR